MSTFAPTAEFAPYHVSDQGVSELRSLSLKAMDPAPRLGFWLHGWCDSEQARRTQAVDTCTARHAVCLPLMAEWSNVECGQALEASSILAHSADEFTAGQFAERLALAVAMESARRLKQLPSEGS